jgi:HEPN domain-containing protein
LPERVAHQAVGYDRSIGAVSPAIMPPAAQNTVRKNRKDFQRLAELRAKEAAALARSRNQQGAYYLAGLAVECALKASIAKKTRRHDFPSNPKYAGRVYSHDLAELLKEADLNRQLDKDMETNPQLAENWGVIKAWTVDCRYETVGLNGKDMVDSLNSADGVMTWIKLHW